jgi:hypothetical protein
MASEEKIRARIREIGDSPKNVTLADIEWVMERLKQYGDVDESNNEHQKLFHFGGESFGICTHRKGSKQLKPAYVKNFLNAMIKTGWYE